jgi:hypothetical protein
MSNSTFSDGVANLWTEFSARDRKRMVKNGDKRKNPRNFLVAATFEKANTYVFAALIIRDREVGVRIHSPRPKTYLQSVTYNRER